MQQLSTYKILQRFHPFKLCTHFNTTHLPKEPVNFKAKGVVMTAVSDKSCYTCILQHSHILKTFAFSNISAFSSWRRFTAFEGWKTRLSCVRSYLIMTFLSQNNVWTSGFVVSIFLRKIIEQFLRIDLGVFLLMASGSEDEGGQLVAAQRRWERKMRRARRGGWWEWEFFRVSPNARFINPPENRAFFQAFLGDDGG